MVNIYTSHIEISSSDITSMIVYYNNFCVEKSLLKSVNITTKFVLTFGNMGILLLERGRDQPFVERE